MNYLTYYWHCQRAAQQGFKPLTPSQLRRLLEKL